MKHAKARLYHLVSIREDNGNKVYLTSYPMTHAWCRVLKSKFTVYSFRRIQFEEVVAQQAILNLPATIYLSFDSAGGITLWSDGLLIGSFTSQEEAEQVAHSITSKLKP